VQLLGDRVALAETAIVDVASATGDGQVFIGGSYQGQGPLPNARQTFVGPTVTINANANDQGTGGTVIVWADEATRFAGTIQAQGGTAGGDGGFVEVSGREQLQFTGWVDTSASLGTDGTLLLDPTNITIVDGAVLPPNAADGFWGFDEDPGNQTIGAAAVKALLEKNDVTLQASEAIAVQGTGFTVSSANDFTLQAATIEIRSIIEQSGGGDIIVMTPQTPGNYLLLDAGAISTDTQTAVTGGTISITTHDVRMQNGGSLLAGTLAEGDAGTVEINASGDVVVVGPGTKIDSQVLANATGDSGGVSIQTNNLTVSNGGRITTSTAARGAGGTGGDAGTIDITAVGDVVVTGTNSQIVSQVGNQATGDSQGITIQARNLSVVNEATITTDTDGDGDAGFIDIDVTGLTLVADDATISSQVRQNADGDSEGILITTHDLAVLNGAEIAADTKGTGSGGFIEIEATGTVVVTDAAIASEIFETSQLPDGTPPQADDKNGIGITANQLALRSGEISTSTRGDAIAGPITIQSFPNRHLVINLSDGAQIAATTSSEADGGDITLMTDGALTAQGNGRITVASLAADSGTAGTLTVESRSAVLRDGVTFSARTASSQGGGFILFKVDEAIVMRRGSLINAESTSPALVADSRGGDIFMTAGFLIAPPGENNDIIANAVGGSGGTIDIKVANILGFSDRTDARLSTATLRGLATNDLSASSQQGDQGKVDVSTLEVDPSTGLIELPTDLTDRTNDITPGCGLGNANDNSEFVITGRGGLPPSASEPLTAEGVEVPWVVNETGTAIRVAAPSPTAEQRVIEAQGVALDAAGNPYLVGYLAPSVPIQTCVPAAAVSPDR
jgi:large exoprotein involved in heme utilization and adhesion